MLAFQCHFLMKLISCESFFNAYTSIKPFFKLKKEHSETNGFFKKSVTYADVNKVTGVHYIAI